VTGTVVGRTPTRTTLAVVLCWPTLLAVALCWPLLARPGHPLARDLVFLPYQPLTWASAGLGEGAPRAVPLDAVMSVLTAVVDGGVVARVALPLILVLAAAGVVRMLPWLGPVAWLAAAGVTVWNPFVVERLALGQWALLTSYAALPWLLRALAHQRDGTVSGVGPVVGWAALASITPTGGLIAAAAALASVMARGRRQLVPLALVLLLQLPWLVAGVVGSASRLSDPEGVAVFAPDSEGRFGAAVAVLGLGGIWDSLSEPASRTTVLAVVTAVVVVVTVVFAARELHERLDLAVAWWILGVGGLLFALVMTTAPGQAALRVLVAEVPASGLLRDAQKFLVPTVLLVALAVGVTVDRILRALRRWLPDAVEMRLVLAVPLVVAPLLLLPDGARLVWQTLDPVQVPMSSYAEVDRITKDSGRAVAVLPWRAYRRFAWGHGLTSSDPAPRALRARTVVSDDLQVGSRRVQGEGALAGRVGKVLASNGASRELGELGIGWVVVYPDDPDAASVDVTGLVPRYEDAVLALYEVPHAVPVDVPSVAARTLVVIAYAATVALLACVACARLASLVRRRR
jgi:hypothetical protein